MAKVKILPEYCKSCQLCIEACPKGVLKVGDKANAKGYYTVVPAFEEKCNGCTLCAIVCPDVAIEVYK
ncbi:MAG: 4Fe-4S dicluster domain-containing protein [Peptococcales bacterium]|jgi:2-oxoglutarate ferredoxin oxidoreductase subunit delta